MVSVYQIRPDCENWIDCTEKYYAEWKGDKRTLYNHAAPCARCAELEATNRQLNREVISVGDEAEDYAGKLAALEAENARLIERFELAVETKTQQQATIAQQAEQLAAAEKDACALWMMLDDIDTGGDIAKADDVLYRAIAEHSHKRRFEPRFEWVIKAIDAAIAARKGEK